MCVGTENERYRRREEGHRMKSAWRETGGGMWKDGKGGDYCEGYHIG